MKKNIIYSRLFLAIASVTTSHQVYAQQGKDGAPQLSTEGKNSPAGGIEDIIVVAQKREERIQDVPIAIAAVTADTLVKAGVQDVYDLGQSVAGFVASPNNTTGSLVATLRGVGSTVGSAGYENSVALYLDGVYSASTDGSLLRLNNIERIEVLKGPQGTLFGRNASGGVINIITRDPSHDFSASARIGYDTYRTIQGNGYVTGGLSDDVAVDLGFTYLSQDKPYGHNFARNEDYQKSNYELAVRSKIVITPGETSTIRIIGDYTRSKSSRGFPVPILGGPIQGAFVVPAPGPYDSNADESRPRRNRGGGISLQVEQQIGELNLVNILAYRTQRTTATLDADASPLPVLAIPVTQFQRQLTNELRLESGSGGDLTWLIGAYYFRFNSSYDPIITNFGPIFAPLPTSIKTIRDDVGQLTKSYAGFGQASLRIGEHTTFTAGLRYSYDKARRYGTEIVTLNDGTSFPSAAGIANLPATATFKKLTWRFSLDHKLNDHALIYASVNRGFKGGGFNPNNTNDTIPYQPETIDAYEIGIKADPIPDILRTNLAAYYYDYKNPQFPVIIQQVAFTRNAPKAEIYGIDADINIAPTRALDIRIGLAWNHARFGTFLQGPVYIGCPAGVRVPCAGDISGNRLPTVPDFTATGSASYDITLGNGGSIELNGNVKYQSATTHDAARTYTVPAYAIVNASITWRLPDDKVFVRAYVDNVTDKVAIARYNVTTLAGLLAVRNDPRTAGLTVGFDF